jgi:hypothetical protein
MAQIRARRQADGSTRYTAIIAIRKGRALIQQEYRTFAQRSAAAGWAKHREVQIENQAVPGRRQHDPITLAALIRWYIDRAILGSRTETHIVYRLGNATGRLLAESGLPKGRSYAFCTLLRRGISRDLAT